MSATARLMAFVKDRPLQWLSAFEFQQFGALCWRTEISRARKKFEAVNDGTIENRLSWKREHEHFCPAVQAWDIPGACQCNRSRVVTISEYRYLPPVETAPAVGHDLNEFSLRGERA